MSYSKRYRERTIEYRQAGHSLEATHQVFKVSKSTIQKWEKHLKETGNLEKKDLHRSFRKIDPEKTKAYVAAHPVMMPFVPFFNCGNYISYQWPFCAVRTIWGGLRFISEGEGGFALSQIHTNF